MCKNELISHFLEFGLSDPLEIAYYDRAKRCLRLAYHIYCVRSFKDHPIAPLEPSKKPKMRFLIIFFEFGQ